MILPFLILLLAIPVGILIKGLTEDELKDGRKWFRIIFIASASIGSWFVLSGNYNYAFSLFFISIVAFISLMK